MRSPFLGGGFALLTALAALTLAPVPLAAQGKAPAAPPARTPDGKPNLAGIYSFSTITPLQRPGDAQRQGDVERRRSGGV